MGLEFILALLGIGAKYLEGLKSKAGQTAGEAIDLVDQATLAVLQENAKIKGLTIDWTDGDAVQAFLASLPVFTPIPDPGAPPPPITQ